MTSLIKLKMNLKADEGRKIPWQQLYLVKKEDIGICSSLFRYFLIVSRDEEVKGFLSEFSSFSQMVTHGMTRDDHITLPIDGQEAAKLIDFSKYSLVVPLMAQGRVKGNKYLRYFTSKAFRYQMKQSASSYEVKHRDGTAIEMPEVFINAGKDMQGLPCVNCKNLAVRLSDNPCQLGSRECLKNIVLGNGSDFNSSKVMPSKEELELRESQIIDVMEEEAL